MPIVTDTLGAAQLFARLSENLDFASARFPSKKKQEDEIAVEGEHLFFFVQRWEIPPRIFDPALNVSV